MPNKKAESVFLKISVFFATLAFSLSAIGQQPYIPFQHLSSQDGLTHNQILSILQDKQGFMWIGTLEGLNKYDGYEFTIFNHDKKDSTSLSDDFVSTLLEDKAGTLWIGTGAGLNRYDRATNTFQSYLHDPKNPKSISNGLIHQVLEDEGGNLWIAFSSGYVDYFDLKKKEFTHYQINGDLVDITALELDTNHNLWIGTQQGIVTMNTAHQITHRYQYSKDNPTGLGNNSVNDLFRDRDGIIWIATEGGLDRYDGSSQKFIHYTHSDTDPNTISVNSIKCIEEDAHGWLWIGTINGGLDIWDRSNNKIYYLSEKEADARGINDNSIYSLFRDRNDNMWVGTNSSGINFYDSHQKPFVIYQNIPGLATSLSNNKVNAVAEQPGKGFWIATDGGGLNFFDDKKNVFKAYRHKANNANTLPGDYIVDVVWDARESCLWIATWGAGLSCFNPATGKFKNFRHQADDPSSLASDNLWRLYLDNTGVLYVGTLGKGLSIYDKSTSRFHSYDPSDGIAEENVVCMFRDSKDFLWLGSWGNGLTRMKASDKKTVALPKGINLKSNEFITEDSLGGIWITGNPGILYYNLKTDSSFHLTSDDGLLQSNINGMLDDKRGNFWVSTNKGIIKFNPKRKQFSSFTMTDGLPTNQFTSRLLRANDGKMYFGSVNGLVVFHPDSITQLTAPPELVITDFKIFNKSVFVGGSDHILEKPISETKEIWIPFYYNFITLNYIALNHTLSPRNQYAYKLEKFNNDWVYVGQQRSASFTSLDPGDYTFLVKASNNDGIWSDQAISLVIHVMPPWWDTYLFKIIAVVFIVVIVFSVYRYRVRTIKRQNVKLSALVAERTRKLEDLNAEISIQNITLQERQNEIEVQNEELKQSKEEISAQWDIVTEQNLKLEEARATIERQNEETKKRNDNLEAEVQLRTKELLEYNKQLEQFAFISAHNLRAPVARIIGLGNVLDLNLTSVEENKIMYQNMVTTAHELDRVVRDLNTILEIRKNNHVVISEIAFENELVLAKRYSEKVLEETRGVINADFSKAPVVRSVKPYVESILHNLLSNALKYKHPDRVPVVTIHTERKGEYICLIIEDNGLGIDTESFRDKLFKLYQRFHTHVEGKGLGLYLIKTQIEALGGRIELESKMNEGTVFKVYFKI